MRPGKSKTARWASAEPCQCFYSETFTDCVRCQAQLYACVCHTSQSDPLWDFKEGLRERAADRGWALTFTFHRLRVRGGCRGLALKSAVWADSVYILPAHRSLQLPSSGAHIYKMIPQSKLYHDYYDHQKLTQIFLFARNCIFIRRSNVTCCSHMNH